MTNIKKIIAILVLSSCSMFASAQVETINKTTAPVDTTSTNTLTQTPPAPTRNWQILFNKQGIKQNSIVLKGLSPEQIVTFSIRKDELVTAADLKLQYTPSPSLIPVESQLKVYLNDQLMNVITITADQLGKANNVVIPLDIRYISDFNQIKFTFIGHYRIVCENPASTTLWIDISQGSSIDLTLQKVDLANDLTNFPEPFFDELDERPVNLEVLFPGKPNIKQQKAAAILSSWFGTKALWRGQSVKSYFDQMPENNAIVFATNKNKPSIIPNIDSVNAPTIKMITSPTNPYQKLLLVLGRDDDDLITAVNGIAQGNILFRGDTVTVDREETIKPRIPYDAPNWVRIDRPTTFVELQKFNQQLQTSGINPYPIALTFDIPPDLYLDERNGVQMLIKYRYTPSPLLGDSHLNIGINNYFIKSYDLLPTKEQSSITGLPLLKGMISSDKNLLIPNMQIFPNNTLNFNFDYSTIIGGGTADGHCVTFTFVGNYASIDGNSTIDFSNYHHYLAMPNLKAFAKAGFPFSRMADLSQTIVLVSKTPTTDSVNTLLDVTGNIGSQTGYPALGISLTDDWSVIKNLDNDVLIIGPIPANLKSDSQINALIDQTKSWINEPFKQPSLEQLPIEQTNSDVNTETTISSTEPMAAIIEFQSPYYSERSIVALLADSTHGFSMLNNTLTDKLKQDKIFGSATVIKESEVNSVIVGNVYHVGHLPWWLRIWITLKNYPIFLAIISIITAIILSIISWHLLTSISRRRLNTDKQD